MTDRLDRRRFLALLGTTAAGAGLAACGRALDPPRYTAEDVAALERQRKREGERSGQGPFGAQRYRGYRGLAELPWFELDAEDRLRCVDESVPMTIDVHCHLGMSVLFRPELDLQARTARVRHLLDCDGTRPGCELDLDVYVNGNFTPEALSTLERELLAQGLWGSASAETQTIPNLLDEMDSMRVEQAVILPIALGLPFGDDLTEQWMRAIDSAGATRRLRPGLSVHPRDPDRHARLAAFARTGARVLKLHPTMQRFYPDDPSMMDLYAHARDLDLVVFFHGGRAGIEPESSRRYALPRHYEGALAGFPTLPFVLGHAGARDGEAMLDLAVRHPNAWLGIHGQGVSHLDRMLRRTGGERMVFGSDWPFYHVGASLAKVLIVTQDSGRAGARRAILRDNALELLG